MSKLNKLCMVGLCGGLLAAPVANAESYVFELQQNLVSDAISFELDTNLSPDESSTLKEDGSLHFIVGVNGEKIYKEVFSEKYRYQSDGVTPLVDSVNVKFLEHRFSLIVHKVEHAGESPTDAEYTVMLNLSCSSEDADQFNDYILYGSKSAAYSLKFHLTPALLEAKMVNSDDLGLKIKEIK